MKIRCAKLQDLEAVTRVESVCFPEAEAASRECFAQRLSVYPNHFWITEDAGKVIGFINGMVTNRQTIVDEMFDNASLHREDGAWQSVFGLAVLPEYRNRGHAARLMDTLTEAAWAQGRRGCILTCKEELISFYERFGYRKLGVSQSVHGGALWYDMVLEF